MFIFTYLSIAVLVMYVTAVGCYVCKKKFNLITNAIAAILWPLSIPITIYEVLHETKDYPL
jgi:hypothetical protein